MIDYLLKEKDQKCLIQDRELTIQSNIIQQIQYFLDTVFMKFLAKAHVSAIFPY